MARARRARWVSATLTVALLPMALTLATTTPQVGAEPVASAAAMRSIEPSELGVADVGGVTFDAAAGRLIVSDRQAKQVVSIDALGDSATGSGLPSRPDPATLSVDPISRRLTAVRNGDVLSTSRAGRGSVRRPLREGLHRIVAAEFDVVTGRWFALVNGGTAMAVLAGAPDQAAGPAALVDLRGIGRGRFRAIAPNPADGLVYLLGDRLYGVDAAGALQRTVDLTRVDLRAPSDMAFAPSADATDGAGVQSLYVVDEDATAGSTRLVEATLAAAAVTTDAVSTLVATHDLYQLSPPSPDSSGVAYLPDRDRLIVSDGEVDEMAIFQGVNLYELTRSGTLSDTGVTTAVSDEPTGVGYDPATRALFTSDDDDDEIYRFLSGTDGRHGTGDDQRSSFDTRVFGARDAEDVAVDTTRGHLFIVDGVNKEVYRVQPNANGFNGVPAKGGDDTVTNFDVGVYGALDPEGIAYDSATDHLLVLDDGSLTVYELTLDGALVRSIDVSASGGRNLAGIALAPPSGGGSGQDMYLVDRGVDNDSNPNENDGRMYEMTLPGGGGAQPNLPPVVDAGPDQSVMLPAGVTLDGTVSDDGVPDPPAAVTTDWSLVSGPGDVTFADEAQVDTNATFTGPGSYVLGLTANDGAIAVIDTVQVTVSAEGEVTLAVPVSAGTDDAEEDNATGAVDLASSDIEMVQEGAVNQTVGLRFAGVPVPQGAVITGAYVQFITDDTDGGTPALTIEGQAADDAPTFTSAARNISSRPRTTASVVWSPPAWLTIGEAGAAQRTPDLATVVQEIVDRLGWAEGRSLALIVTGTGQRTAEAFNSGAALAARLHISYTSDGEPNLPPAVDAGLDQTVTFPAAASLDGTVSDDGLPDPPAAVTTTWAVVSGPGNVAFDDASAVDTTATFSSLGTYVLRLTVSDSVRSASDDVEVVVVGGGGETFTIEVAVSASGDDAEENNAGGAVDLTSPDIELVSEGTRNQTVGLRFASVPLPVGAVVEDAYVQFVTDETDGSAMALTIRGEAADDATTFTTTPANVSSRPRTTASVGWSPPRWSIIGEAGAGQRTPSLAAIVQEIIDRPGWVSGRPVALIVTGTGRRTAESFNSGAALAPRLHITYSMP